jgi:hypothetical protein
MARQSAYGFILPLMAFSKKYFQSNFTGHVGNLVKSHGEATGNCILSDRVPNTFVCEISSWCPVEIDRLPLDREDGPLIPGAESYTVFIKNSISFTRFGEDYHRNNMPRGICIYEHDDEGKRKTATASILDAH